MRAWSIGYSCREVCWLTERWQRRRLPRRPRRKAPPRPASAGQAAKGSGAPGNVTQARVLAEAGRGDNWLVSGGNFESQHFSPLKSITDQNIGELGLAWTSP